MRPLVCHWHCLWQGGYRQNQQELAGLTLGG